MGKTPYDDFADIYDDWVATAPVTHANLAFYAELATSTEGPVAELGAGDGRIALEIAARGKSIVALDNSAAMLARLRERAEVRGLTERIHALEADMRDFALPEPAALITLPFHSVGHLLTDEDKRATFRCVHDQLAPGGRFVFDHFVYDPAYAKGENVPMLRSESVDPETGGLVYLWSVVRYDNEAQVMRVIVWSDRCDTTGLVIEKRYRPIQLSWSEPEQLRALLEETGFEVEACYGDFERNAFAADSPHQVWVARRA